MLKALLRRPGTQAALARAANAYLGFALDSTRWTLDGAETFAPFALGHPAIVAFWHETLSLSPAIWLHARRARIAAGCKAGRMHVLVSRHSDGRFIGEVVRRFGVDLIRGSSSTQGKNRGGQQAARALAAVLAAGDQVAITPDGPRGPWRRAAPGVAQLAALAGVPVVPVAAASTRMRRLPTWDRMAMPLPWGRGVLVCGEPLAVEAGQIDAMLPRIEAALTAAVERAEAMCR